jgi:hypothetical protein
VIRRRIMEIAVNENISILDEVKIQAQVLVPVLQTLRAELGRERADQIVCGALRDWRQRVYEEVAKRTAGGPREKWASLTASSISRIGGDIDVEMLKQEPDAMEFNVTGCRYADFFRSLGEPELGAVLLCEGDDQIAEIGSPEVQFTRTQTIMKGAKYCDFRYRMKSGT